MTKQPEALRLAEMLETGRGWNPKEAAAELRRLHEVEQAGRQALEALIGLLVFNTTPEEYKQGREAVAAMLQALGDKNA